MARAEQTSSLEVAIKRTLSYFDLFSYPLTAQELYQSLWNYHMGEEYSQFLYLLEELVNTGRIGYKPGYYFLPNRQTNISDKERSVKYIDKKLAIARWAATKISYVPFVLSFFVCNTVASGTAKEDSDIDVLIIVKSGRLWFTRLAVTGLLAVARLRRTPRHIANRICLSFYITSDALNLRPIALDGADIYLAYWLRDLIPIYDSDSTYNRLRSANAWAGEALSQARAYSPASRIQAEATAWSKYIKKGLEWILNKTFGDCIESQAKKMQQWRIKKHRNQKIRPLNSGVVVSDTMLKFHENDRRDYLRNQWKKRCAEIIS